MGLLMVLAAAAASIWVGFQLFSAPDGQQPGLPPVIEDAAQTIEKPRVALLLPLSGPFREDGRMSRLGAELAWADLQERGVRGELKFIDAAGDAATVEGLASETARDPSTLVVLGMLPEAVSTRIAPIFEQHQLPLLIPDGSHQNYSHRQWVLPMLGSDRKEGAFAARLAGRMGTGKRVAVVRLPGGYGDVLATGFAEEAKRGDLAYEPFEAGKDPAAVADVASRIIQSDPGLLYLAGPPQWGARLIDALMDKAYAGKIIVPRVYGLLNPRDLFGKRLEHLLIVRAVADGDEEDQRIRSFRRKFQERNLMNPDRLAVLSYDAVMWLGECMLQGPAGRASLLAQLRRANAPESAYHGLSGSYYFDSDGQLEHSLLVTVFRDGKFVPYREPTTAAGGSG